MLSASKSSLSFALAVGAVLVLAGCAAEDRPGYLKTLPKGYCYNLENCKDSGSLSKDYKKSMAEDDMNAAANENAGTMDNDAGYEGMYGDMAVKKLSPEELARLLAERALWTRAARELSTEMDTGFSALVDGAYLQPTDLNNDREKDFGHVLRKTLTEKGYAIPVQPEKDGYTLRYRLISNDPGVNSSFNVNLTLLSGDVVLHETSDNYELEDLEGYMPKNSAAPSGLTRPADESSVGGPTPLY
ncbi:MAG: hypothetical protein H6868_01900 [Rhodospirillales bacterium]|nr:hypothetical protein [Rhodospirillales bacterium]